MPEHIPADGESLLKFTATIVALVSILSLVAPTAAIGIATITLLGTTTSLLILSIIESTPEPDPHDTAPEEVLKRRYAEGELTDEEFQHRLDILLDAETDEQELELNHESA